ncbi:hypothetical protein ACWA2C_16595 [Priestia megaterium]
MGNIFDNIALDERDKNVLNAQFGTIDKLFTVVQRGWLGYPATVTCKVITRRSQFPKWEDCKKDHVYVGVIRRKRGDRVIIVRHSFETELSCKIPAEHLKLKDLLLSIWPEQKNMNCSQCGEFATRMDSPGICMDCWRANKEKKSTI